MIEEQNFSVGGRYSDSIDLVSERNPRSERWSRARSPTSHQPRAGGWPDHGILRCVGDGLGWCGACSGVAATNRLPTQGVHRDRGRGGRWLHGEQARADERADEEDGKQMNVVQATADQ